MHTLLFGFAKDPLMHFPVGSESPSVEQYVPALHCEQVDVFAPEEEYDPIGHRPDVAVSPVPAQYIPESQSLQLLESISF